MSASDIPCDIEERRIKYGNDHLYYACTDCYGQYCPCVIDSPERQPDETKVLQTVAYYRGDIVPQPQCPAIHLVLYPIKKVNVCEVGYEIHQRTRNTYP